MAASSDTLTRARAVLATIHATREAGYLAAPGAWDEALAPAIEIDAMPALIRLAEAVGAIVAGGGPGGPWWWHDEGCVACGHDGYVMDPHAPDCPALAIEAALAELAALGGGEAG